MSMIAFRFFKYVLLLDALFLVGCGPTSTTNDGPTAAANAVQSANNSMQTIEGDGFRFQAPQSWTKLAVPSGIAVSSPSDIVNGIAGIPVGMAVIPVPSPATPPDLMESLLQNNRALGEVESETQVKVAGRDATKLVHTMAARRDSTGENVLVTRMVRVFVPLDAGILTVQIQGDDAQVKALMPQIDAIFESIELK